MYIVDIILHVNLVFFSPYIWLYIKSKPQIKKNKEKSKCILHIKYTDLILIFWVLELYMALNNNEHKQNLYTLKCKKNTPSITHLKIENKHNSSNYKIVINFTIVHKSLKTWILRDI